MSEKNRSFHIFPQLFTPKKKNHILSIVSFLKEQRQQFYILCAGSILLSCGFLCILTLYTVSFFGFTNPFTQNTDRQIALAFIQKEEPLISGEDKRIENQALTYEGLLGKRQLNEYPLLATIKEIISSQTDWTRALIGLDDAIKETLSTNDILKRILLGTVSFTQNQRSIILENLRIYGTKGGAEGTEISLAGKLLDALEKSPVFKNVTSSTSLEQKIEVQQGGQVSEVFIPLQVQFFYQDSSDNSDAHAVPSLKEEVQKNENTSTNK